MLHSKAIIKFLTEAFVTEILNFVVRVINEYHGDLGFHSYTQIVNSVEMCHNPVILVSLCIFFTVALLWGIPWWLRR